MKRFPRYETMYPFADETQCYLFTLVRQADDFVASTLRNKKSKYVRCPIAIIPLEQT